MTLESKVGWQKSILDVIREKFPEASINYTSAENPSNGEAFYFVVSLVGGNTAKRFSYLEARSLFDPGGELEKKLIEGGRKKPMSAETSYLEQIGVVKISL